MRIKRYDLKDQQMTVQASTVLKVLGKSSLFILDILIRESVQNSLDAVSENCRDYIKCFFHINKSKDHNELINRISFLQQDKNTDHLYARLINRIRQNDPVMLVLSDKGTTGLSGPVRRNESSWSNYKGRRNFENLVYQLGLNHGASGAGGSYGFGKSIYYHLSTSGLVMFYSKSNEGERLIFSMISSEENKSSTQATGIAWWGNIYKDKGVEYSAPIEKSEKINEIVPSAELMRFCLDGSEAVQTAFRIARAKTGKQKFLRFEGHYHGWMDNVCWGISAKSVEDLGNRENPNVFPWTEGLPKQTREEFIVLPWNDLALLKETVKNHHKELAAIITEPVMCNNGCISPEEGFLQGMRELCNEYSIALIFDEVITGFRLSLGGAQSYFNISPDLSIFAKAIASGYPLSVIAGKKEWMNLIEDGKVIQAGTMNSSNATVAAALATIKVLETENPYERFYRLGRKLMNGLRQASLETNQNLLVQGLGPVFHIGFTHLNKVKDYRDTFTYDKKKLGKFVSNMHDSGVRIIGRGLWYISAAHTEEDIEIAIDKAKHILETL